MRLRLHLRLADQSGFTLLETLIATVLMVAILLALATVTAQWMPNWNRGMLRAQQMERLAVGLDRIVADLSAAEFVTPGGGVKTVAFEGGPLSVTFVRTAVGPNTPPGLEVIRLVERADPQGLALMREKGLFRPSAPGSSVQFSDAVVLIRAPYRVSFSYAGRNQDWRTDWQDATELPTMIRVAVRDAISDRMVLASTVAVVQVNLAADCVRAKNISQCIATGRADDAPSVDAPRTANTPPNTGD